MLNLGVLDSPGGVHHTGLRSPFVKGPQISIQMLASAMILSPGRLPVFQAFDVMANDTLGSKHCNKAI